MNMALFLSDDIVAKIEAIKSADAGMVEEFEVAPGENVIGVLSEDLQKLYVVYAKAWDEMKEFGIELNVIIDGFGGECAHAD